MARLTAPLPIGIGRPRGLLALPEAHAGPAFATLVGLALYGHANPLDLRTMNVGPRENKGGTSLGWWHKLVTAVKANY